MGKGNKERTAYIRNGSLRAMKDWLAVRGDAPGAVFCVINKAGVIFTERHMSTTSIHRLVNKRAEQAGVADVSAHDFRRTFVGELLDAGQDITT